MDVYLTLSRSELQRDLDDSKFRKLYRFNFDHNDLTFTIGSALTKISVFVTSQRRSAPRGGQALEAAEKAKKERGEDVDISW